MKVEVPTVLRSQSNDVNTTSSSIVMSVTDSKLDEQTKPHSVMGTTSISSSLLKGPVNNTQSEVSLPSEHFHKALSTRATTISDNSMKIAPSDEIGDSDESAEIVSGQQLTMYPDDDAEVVSGHPTLIADKSTKSLTDHPRNTSVSSSKRSSSKRSSSKRHSNKKKKRPSQSHSQRVSIVENSKKSRRRLRRFISIHFIIL